jgi:hypothetical protein
MGALPHYLKAPRAAVRTVPDTERYRPRAAAIAQAANASTLPGGSDLDLTGVADGRE